MKFPLIKQEDGSLALEVPDDLLQQLTSQPSSQAEAKLKESADLEATKPLVDRVSEWVDTRVIAELVIGHLKAEGMPATFEKAKEVWLDTLQMLGSHLAELEEKLANAESRTMDDFTPAEKADFVITWGKGLSMEDKAVFAMAVGIPIAAATDAEVSEAEAKHKGIDDELKIIQGRTTLPGYKFLEYLNLSVKEA